MLLPPAFLEFLAPCAAVLGAASVGLYLGALLPRLGTPRSAWRVRRNLEDFQARFGLEGNPLWKAFLVVSACALLLGLLSMAFRVHLLTAW